MDNEKSSFVSRINAVLKVEQANPLKIQRLVPFVPCPAEKKLTRMRPNRPCVVLK